MDHEIGLPTYLPIYLCRARNATFLGPALTTLPASHCVPHTLTAAGRHSQPFTHSPRVSIFLQWSPDSDLTNVETSQTSQTGSHREHSHPSRRIGWPRGSTKAEPFLQKSFAFQVNSRLALDLLLGHPLIYNTHKTLSLTLQL